ncbi:MAG: hypothetical protein M3O23_00200 [Actinomycetota bacterium]|nr:hypothetical protein [Actinomycetota bacterium]
MSQILQIVAVVIFLIAGLSAFSDDINVNELGWISLGLAAWAAASLVPATFAAPAVRRRRIVR